MYLTSIMGYNNTKLILLIESIIMRDCSVCKISFKNLGIETECSIKCKLMSRHKKDENGCWLWTRGLRNGYGKLRFKVKVYPAHRASYETFIGPIEKDKFVCHKCDVKHCINPEHLFLGTRTENLHDAIEKKIWDFRGEKSHLTKFTDIQVEEMRMLKNEGFSYKRIQRIFNCAHSYIYLIMNKKIRKV